MTTEILTEHPSRLLRELSSVKYVELYEDENNEGEWIIYYEDNLNKTEIGMLIPYEFTKARGVGSINGVQEGDIGSKIRYSGHNNLYEEDIGNAIDDYRI